MATKENTLITGASKAKNLEKSNKVYAVKCPGYEQAEDKLAELLHMMGRIDQFAASGEKIALKVNLLLAAEPEKAITTHPAIVAAVGRMAKAQGAKPFIIDSPTGGYQYNEDTMRRVYRISKMTDAAREAGIELNFDTTYQAVSFPDGELTKHFDIITPLVEADGVLNLCKLKTHTYMGMTGAIKNNFGAVPGRAKPGYHAKLHDSARFAGMLLDLAACVAPRLSIMDAVVGMEGDGPNAGTPRRIGLLLASENPLTLDVVASEIIGLPLENNPVLAEAKKRGNYPTQIEEVDLVGIDVTDLRIPDYALPTTLSTGGGLANLSWWQKAAAPLFRAGLTVKPRVIEDRCIACGACRDICPMHTITIKSNGHHRYAQIDDKGCIRCYCCHETCPQDAIELHQGLLYRVINT
jgi:uncharacterized protein (DUF362 family)/Pyruvate/2-oxoacid:ferredoxin oxidoreductase delta subunit